jgi:hypothetical protein
MKNILFRLRLVWFRLLALILLTLWFSPAARAQLNLLVNGGFDVRQGQSYSIAPWVQTGTLLLTAGGCQTANGPNAIGIVSGLLYQDVPTVPGERYRLSLFVAGWAPDGPLPFIHNIAVDWGSQRVGVTSFDSTGRTFNDMGWSERDFEVQATGNLTRLAFSNFNEISNPNIPLLDNVQLVAIPEPTAWRVLGLALAACLITRPIRAGRPR